MKFAVQYFSCLEPSTGLHEVDSKEAADVQAGELLAEPDVYEVHIIALKGRED
jgi:hypothetical protein